MCYSKNAGKPPTQLAAKTNVQVNGTWYRVPGNW